MAEEPDDGTGTDRPAERDDDEEPRVTSDADFNSLAADPDPDGDAAEEGDGAGSPEDDGPTPAITRVDDGDGVSEPDGDGVVSPADDPDTPTVDDVETPLADEEAGVSDGGYADEGDAGGMYDDIAFDDDDIADGADAPAVEGDFDGAPDDQEMPLADHIEEMVKRLGVVVVAMAVVSGIAFPFGTDLINFLWYDYLPGTFAECPTIGPLQPGGPACPQVYHPLAVILARLKVATLVGFVIALPLFVYETYLFMRPGLFPRERRYYLASVPTSLLLALVGIVFAHFIVIPFLFDYFVSYSQNATIVAFGLTETFDLIVLLLGAFAIVFQIPLFVMLALMMGLVTREWMEGRRLIFWGVFAALAFLFAPDPTGMAPIIVAATMIVLFEGTLLLAKWTRRG
ncbi:twin-arginine translocase subunit TatC [Halosegnis marinus]|uniref:Sec-independent protein translocase protein TatC n=1 Tax=Halosegnis marinus TaxID=3034023 RepID=A0ABD5ZNA0_9EURY|nr:twin-arginine translocase subunit TatC [Halosegnis sp. DT85]